MVDYYILDKYMPRSVAAIKNLSAQKKAAIGLALLYRQKDFVRFFDESPKTSYQSNRKIYNDFSEFIAIGKKLILSAKISDTQDIKNRINNIIIHDTKAPPLMDSLLKCIFVGLEYFFNFYSSFDDEYILVCIEQHMDAISVSAYMNDCNYDHQVIFEKESLMFDKLINLANNCNLNFQSDLDGFMEQKISSEWYAF
jgi:hypothetical protein